MKWLQNISAEDILRWLAIAAVLSAQFANLVSILELVSPAHKLKVAALVILYGVITIILNESLRKSK